MLGNAWKWCLSEKTEHGEDKSTDGGDPSQFQTQFQVSPQKFALVSADCCVLFRSFLLNEGCLLRSAGYHLSCACSLLVVNRVDFLIFSSM